MAHPEDPQASAETRQRLLEAAGEVFAAKGFRGATTREICRKAGANVAAVNYHFAGKEGLYEAVVHHAHRHAAERYPLASASETPGSPADRFRAFVEWFLFRTLCEGRPAWQAKLLAREMIEPTRALDTLVETEIRPLLETLQSLCRELMGPGADDDEVRLAARSVLGQCLYYRHAQPILARLHPEERYSPEYIRRLAAHVTAFSLGGIEKLANERAAQGAPPETTKRKP
ncbi:MAG: CerR family C-terminal domain-containing protein [Deltaproteobacteria bacterium]|nr:CerR family C-terminal domain-containing protein [Deltaproteobacteria bacterium]